MNTVNVINDRKTSNSSKPMSPEQVRSFLQNQPQPNFNKAVTEPEKVNKTQAVKSAPVNRSPITSTEAKAAIASVIALINAGQKPSYEIWLNQPSPLKEYIYKAKHGRGPYEIWLEWLTEIVISAFQNKCENGIRLTREDLAAAKEIVKKAKTAKGYNVGLFYESTMMAEITAWWVNNVANLPGNGNLAEHKQIKRIIRDLYVIVQAIDLSLRRGMGDVAGVETPVTNPKVETKGPIKDQQEKNSVIQRFGRELPDFLRWIFNGKGNQELKGDALGLVFHAWIQENNITPISNK